MAEKDNTTTGETVPCEVCLKEVPVSEAKVDEAADYVRHFCGLECYARWKEKEQKQDK